MPYSSASATRQTRPVAAGQASAGRAARVIDFHDADHASGVVYCRDELERPDTGEWAVGTIQYWDDYKRTDAE